MLGRDHEKDVPSTETVERVIGHAACFNADRSQVITPSHRRLLVLECADRLPALHARVADQNGLFLGNATVQEARDPHIPSVRPELVLAGRSDERPPDVRIRSERFVAERSRLSDQPDRRKHSSVRQWTLSLLRLRFRRSMLRCPRITAVSSAVTPRARMSFELPGIDRELAEIGEAWAECVQSPACPIGRVGGDAEPAEGDREPSHPDVG